MSVVTAFIPPVDEDFVDSNSPWFKLYSASVQALRSGQRLEAEWSKQYREVMTTIFQTILRERLNYNAPTDETTLVIEFPPLEDAEVRSFERFVRRKNGMAINRRALLDEAVDGILELLEDKPQIKVTPSTTSPTTINITL